MVTDLLSMYWILAFQSSKYLGHPCWPANAQAFRSYKMDTVSGVKWTVVLVYLEKNIHTTLRNQYL